MCRQLLAVQYYVYILASAPNGTLYIGVTNDLVRRVYEHREALADGFTKRHGVKTLVYYEIHDSPEQAIRREKALKRWNRDWKIALIEHDNPQWIDLWDGLSGG
ncbi:GIY-YIG nuclease family protein [Pelagibius marinus]|uniref:GIY-YIG nuclease family protein n=1 Tax=Pelagibius marinus TaxID=2762760 RepID=UPI001D03FBC1|nr:GIY-YIG nuclease family protein [Pelagibius marinus]